LTATRAPGVAVLQSAGKIRACSNFENIDCASAYCGVHSATAGVEQRKYVLWRDGVVTPSQKDPRLRGKRSGDFRTEIPALPPTDPGPVVIHRWRRKLKDEEDFHRALIDALSSGIWLSWKSMEVCPDVGQTPVPRAVGRASNTG
jgi:hypothetical protein